MKNKKVLFLIAIGLLPYFCFSQHKEKRKEELGFSFFSLEQNTETLNYRLEPKFVFGISYNKFISKWSWISSLEMGQNTIYDYCPLCCDYYSGKGKMTEIMASTGFRFNFLNKTNFRIKPFFESDIFISSLKYKIDAQGGINGRGVKVNSINSSFGLVEKIGLAFYLTPQLTFNISSSCRMGYGMHKNRTYMGSENGVSAAVAPLQLRVGYFFR